MRLPKTLVPHRRIALIGLGGVAALGHAPFDLWFVSLPALALGMAAIASATGFWRSLWHGWALGFGYFVIGWNWLVEPFLVDLARHGWMAPFGVSLLAGAMAFYWAGAAALTALSTRGPLARLIFLAAALTLAEYFRGRWFTGFPWGMPAYIWIETWVAQVLALVGPHGLNLMTFLLAAAVGALALRPASPTRAAVAGFAVLAVAVTSFVLRPGPAMPPSADAPVVRMVQSGATQREKWRPANLQRFIDLHMAFTSAGEPVDLTIWSETALPYVLDDAGPELALAAEAARGGSVILGAQRREGADWFNSLALVGPEGLLQAVYDKVHLVPYGEYLPFDSLMTRLGLAGLAANPGGGFTAGSERKLIDVPGVGAIMPLICYESVFPAEVATMTERPRAIVLITNDAWFGRFSGPYQHLAQGRARAIELAVPMVRVAQTGVSAVIDGRGRIVASIPLGEAGFLDVALPDELAPTLYAIRGDLPALIGLVLVALSAIGLSLKAIDRGRGAA